MAGSAMSEREIGKLSHQRACGVVAVTSVVVVGVVAAAAAAAFTGDVDV